MFLSLTVGASELHAGSVNNKLALLISTSRLHLPLCTTRPHLTPSQRAPKLQSFHLKMPFKDLLKKKDKAEAHTPVEEDRPDTPKFTFMRTDTNTQEIITPPTFYGDGKESKYLDGNADSRTG